MGSVADPNNRASADSRTLGASSRLRTRRASRTVHSTGGLGHGISHCSAAARRKPISNPALCATSTAPWANSRNIGNTAAMVGASRTIAVVIPVSSTICGGMVRCGSTRVANSPMICPPRTLTAPISVIASDEPSAAALARDPVVSRSTTTNVVSRSDISAAASTSAKLSWGSVREPATVNDGRHNHRQAPCATPTEENLSVVVSSVRVSPEVVPNMNRKEDTEMDQVPTEPGDPVIIDCDDCAVRGPGCRDCVVSVLLGVPESLLEDERAALEVLAEAGLAPRLRLVPVRRNPGSELAG